MDVKPVVLLGSRVESSLKLKVRKPSLELERTIEDESLFSSRVAEGMLTSTGEHTISLPMLGPSEDLAALFSL